MRNKEQYLLTPSRGHRFWVGLPASVHCTVQVHPCWELLVDWVPSTQTDKEGGRCAGWRGSGPCSIWAKQSTSLQHIDFSCIAHWAQLYILMDRMEPLTPGPSPSGTVLIYAEHISLLDPDPSLAKTCTILCILWESICAMHSWAYLRKLPACHYLKEGWCVSVVNE